MTMSSSGRTRVLASALRCALAALLVACAASTKLTSSWKDPQTIGPVRYSRVLAVLVDANPALRRSVEDKLASQIPNATPSYTVIPEERLKDEEWVANKIRDAGFDGAVVMRFVGKKKSTTYVPGAAPVYVVGSRGFATYWGTSWGYSPGYTQEDVTLVVETSLYDINKGKIIWAGRTETVNPSSANEVVTGIVQASVKQMRKDGLIAAQQS
jgi:hypothetical protein